MDMSRAMPEKREKEGPEQKAAGAEVSHVLLLSDSFLPCAGGSREYYNNI